MDLNNLINDDKGALYTYYEMSNVEEDDGKNMTTNKTENLSTHASTRVTTSEIPNAPTNLQFMQLQSPTPTNAKNKNPKFIKQKTLKIKKVHRAIVTRNNLHHILNGF